MRNAEYWIEKLQLLPHPEGGYFREMYRCADIIPGKALPHRFAGARSFSTAIYFLLKSGQISVLHRIHSDELWHFYQGSAVTLQLIHPTGERQTLHLGSDQSNKHSDVQTEKPEAPVASNNYWNTPSYLGDYAPQGNPLPEGEHPIIMDIDRREGQSKKRSGKMTYAEWIMNGGGGGHNGHYGYQSPEAHCSWM